MTQLEWEVAEESSGHPSTPWIFTGLLLNVIQRLFCTFMGQMALAQWWTTVGMRPAAATQLDC